MKLPQARNTDIVVQELHKELLIYDKKINKAFCLNETAAFVYAKCDGQTGLTELKNKRHDLTDEAIYLTLDLLRRENLLDGEYESIFKGVSRREAIKKAALASLIALPVISALAAPPAIQAASSCANQSGPQRPAGLFLGIRSTGACDSDRATCCSNRTVYDGTSTDCQVINNVTGLVGCPCYCN